MIVRIWRGSVPLQKADAYFDLMERVAAPDYRACAGNAGVWALRHDDGEFVGVSMVTLWDSLDSIRAFAGDDVTRAKYYDFDRDYLVTFPETVEHHELISASGPITIG